MFNKKGLLLVLLVIVLAFFVFGEDSQYSISEAANSTACGTVNGNITLTSDVSSDLTCFTINASNVVINCKGLNVTYGVVGTNASGVINLGYDNVSILNCVLVEGNSSGNEKQGINFNNSLGSIVWNNTIVTTGTSSNGIHFGYSNKTNISSNVVRTSGGAVKGFSLLNFANGSVILNSIKTTGVPSRGILLNSTSCCLSEGNNFSFNGINQTASSGLGWGIDLIRAQFNIISNNNINTSRWSALGIQINNSPSNEITKNVIRTLYTGAHGISVNASSSNTIKNNAVFTSGTEASGVSLYHSSSNKVYGNNLTASGNNAYGISISGGSGGNKLGNNNLSSNYFEIFDGSPTSSINYLFYNNTFGMINWTNASTEGFLSNLTFNVTNRITLGINIFIGKNVIAVNTSAFSTGNSSQLSVNSTAEITLRGLSETSISEIRLLSNYTTDSGTILNRGTDCNATSCNILSYSGGILIFNTSYFSSFSALVPHCGVVNANVTLSEDLNSSATCLTINASNIVIDCSGYNITYGSGGGSTYGIYNYGYDNVSVLNCELVEGSTSGSEKHGINFNNSLGSIVWNNTFLIFDGQGSNGINFEYSNRTNISSNSFRISAGGNIQPYPTGISLSNFANGSVVSNSIIASSDLSIGIQLNSTTCCLSEGNNISFNRINHTAPTIAGTAIYLIKTRLNLISNNDINYSGKDVAAILSEEGNLNTITRNTLRSFNSATGTRGIFLNSSTSSTIDHNTITVLGNEGHGIYLVNSSSNKIYENNLTTWGAQGHTISFYGNSSGAGNSSGNHLRNNNLTSFNGFGIHDGSQASSINYLFYNNTYGMINWTNVSTEGFLSNLSLNVTGGLGLGINIFIYNNTVAVNTSAFSTGNSSQLSVNSTAQITLRGLALPSIEEIISLSNYTTSSDTILNAGTDCEGGSCSFLSYSKGVLVFNTNYFSSFSANGLCGTVNANVTLTADLNASGTCFTINASNVVIDCKAYNITYGVDGVNGYGIQNSGYDNVSVLNCRFSEGNSSGDEKHSVNFNNSLGSVIWNNTVTTSGTSSSGIHFEYSNRTNISSNTVSISESSDRMMKGISLFNFANGSVVSNTIKTSGTWSRGIQLNSTTCCLSEGNNLSFNRINHTTGLGEGINLIRSRLNLISYNDINYSLSSGIQVNNSNSNVITQNRIWSPTGGLYGISINSSSSNTIDHNKIFALGNGGVGISLYHSSSNKVYENNLTASGNNGHAMSFSGNSSGNKLGTNNLSSDYFQIMDGSPISSINYLFYNNTYGMINWTNVSAEGFLSNLTFNVTNGLGLGLGINIFIHNNTIAVNTSAFSTGNSSQLTVNSTADVTLRKLDLASVTEVRRLSNYTRSNNTLLNAGTDCNATTCNILSYSSGTLLFNTSYFSSFSVVGTYPTTPSDDTGGGGGGGGGSAGTTKEVGRITVNLGKTGTTKFKKDFGITEIQITPTKDLSSVPITVQETLGSSAEVVSSGSTGTSGGVYKYIKITAGVGKDSIEKANVKFEVTLEWLVSNDYDGNKVVLRHYDEVWKALPTKRTGIDSKNAYYEAETDGFSLFAITAEKKVKKEEVVEETLIEEVLPEEVEEVEEIKKVLEVPFEEELKTNSKSSSKVFLYVVTGLILISLSILIYFLITGEKTKKKRKKKKK
jgi:PGF-pre-PGF domain-containing protein